MLFFLYYANIYKTKINVSVDLPMTQNDKFKNEITHVVDINQCNNYECLSIKSI